MVKKSITFLSIFLLLLSFPVAGQKNINSPYARFNLGTLEPAASFRSLGMGGTGIAMRSNSSIYSINPASYSSIDTNTFIFDIGADLGINIISDKGTDFRSQDINFSHLIMGFPLKKGWGIAMGIIPLSSGYYQLAEVVGKNDPGYDPLVGEYSSYHNGAGGFRNVFIGTGLKINRNFSAGVNMSLLYGQVTRSYQIVFNDYNNVYHDNSVESLYLVGVNLEYGIQYSADLKNDYFLNAGVSFKFGRDYNSDHQLLAYKYTAYNTRDTTSFVSDDSTKAFIPGSLGVGLSFGKKNLFTIGVDYRTTKWSDSKIPGDLGYMADASSIHFGVEYIPEKYSNYSLLKRLEYRLGAHYGDSYLIINNDQIKEYGFSLGLGLPMRRSYSRTNLFFDYTRRNGPGGSLMHFENYFSMGASLNLWDAWFMKRKYE